MALTHGINKMSNDVMLPYGERDGNFIPICDVPSGSGHGCVCPECKRDLIAKKGTEIAHHFAHKPDVAGDHTKYGPCVGAFETLVHKLAKAIISEKMELAFPAINARCGYAVRQWKPGGVVRLTSAIQEDTTLSKSIRPDIYVTHADGRAVVEIFVSHSCTQEKIKWLKDNEIPAIEINLRSHKNSDLGERFTQHVLYNAPRHWISNPSQVKADAWLTSILEREREAEIERERIADQRRELAAQAEVREREKLIAQEEERANVSRVVGVCENIYRLVSKSVFSWDKYKTADVNGLGTPQDICKAGSGACGDLVGRLSDILAFLALDGTLPDMCGLDCAEDILAFHKRAIEDRQRQLIQKMADEAIEEARQATLRAETEERIRSFELEKIKNRIRAEETVARQQKEAAEAIARVEAERQRQWVAGFSDRRYNIMAMAQMIGRQVGSAFSWQDYNDETVSGIGLCPDDICQGDREVYKAYRQGLQDLYDYTINRYNHQPDLCGLPISEMSIEESRTKVRQ